MYNNSSPIDSPHPDLSVDEVPTKLDPYRPADSPTLLYRGSMRGRWRNPESIRPHFQGLPDNLTQDCIDQLRTGLEGVGEVSFALSPEPHISWLFQHGASWATHAGWPQLVPPIISQGFATRAAPQDPPEFHVRGIASSGTSRVMFPVRIGNPENRLDEIRFYLVNFQVMYLVDDVHRHERADSRAWLSLRANGWRVDIERRPDFNQALHHLEEQRGYAVTHNCRLRREDDGTLRQFTFEEAESVLEAVELFASFVRGGMVGLALPVGYRDGVSMFEEWHVTPVDPGRYPDPGHPSPFPGWYLWYDYPGANRKASKWLPPLFNQFAAKWWHPNTDLQRFWRNVFRELIYTYTDAERIDERRGIVPACTALETLGWAILVVTERWLTGDRQPAGGRGGYERLTAADQLRLLLRWAGLTTELPQSLSRLKQKAVSNNWDGPQVVTWVRNRVVHPDRHDQLVDGIAAESWLLAMWYTELVILKLLGYDGYFRDRLDGGQIKRVPWVAVRHHARPDVPPVSK